MHVRGSENERRNFLLYFEVRILNKIQKRIQMFQLSVGHSQMRPPLFYIPASVTEALFIAKKPAAVLIYECEKV